MCTSARMLSTLTGKNMGFFTKADIKQLFGLSAQQALPKSEQEALAQFVRCTIQGCGGECKWIGDVREFDAVFRPDWNKLWARHKSKLPDVRECWAVFGRGGT